MMIEKVKWVITYLNGTKYMKLKMTIHFVLAVD